MATIASTPYSWPYDGDLKPSNTALVIIDMQTDFCGVGGYVDKMGYDLSLTRAPIGPIKALLAERARQGMHVIHTREGHRPDLSDLPANKRWRSRQIGAGIGDPGRAGRILVRGEPGWDIIPELARSPASRSSTNPARARSTPPIWSWCCTRAASATSSSPASPPTCACTPPMRDANDRGFECLMLEDGTGATDHGNHLAALKMIQMQGGVFGAVSHSTR
jgi:nicotinamidase-related amidase